MVSTTNDVHDALLGPQAILPDRLLFHRSLPPLPPPNPLSLLCQKLPLICRLNPPFLL